jgi:hypothetical protein
MLKLYSITEGRSRQKEAPDHVGFVGTSAKARPRHCEISGGGGAVPRADYGGTRPDPKLPAANLVDGQESFVPPRCEALNLLKSQDRRIAFANDGRSPALFGWHGHRSGYRRAQFHRAMIGQGD